MLQESLAAWQPISADLDGERMIVVLPQDVVAPPVGTNLVLGGLCAGWAKGLAIAFEEVLILNRHAFKGVVWEGGLADCEHLVDLPIAAANAEIIGQLRQH